MPQDMMKAMLTATAGSKQDDYTQSIAANLRKYYKAQKQKKDKADAALDKAQKDMQERMLKNQLLRQKSGEDDIDRRLKNLKSREDSYIKNVTNLVRKYPYRVIPSKPVDEKGVETPLGFTAESARTIGRQKYRDFLIKQEKESRQAALKNITEQNKGINALEKAGVPVDQLDPIRKDLAVKEAALRGVSLDEKNPTNPNGKPQKASMAGGVKMPLFWKNALRKTIGTNQRETLRGRPYEWTEEQINYALGKK